MAMATHFTTSGDGSPAMDATLWGELHSFIDLATIYAKLPLDHFFRLRLVCKDWNRLASDPTFLQRCFQAPISEPYFVVEGRNTGHRLLGYEIGRGWNWTRLPRVKCEAAGLLCEDSESNRVFDVHTRMFHALPGFSEVRVPALPVEEEEDYEEPLVGMIVDTLVRPYGFRVILGDEVIGTRIYDSRSGSWTQMPSTHEDSAFGSGARRRPMCAYCNGFLYIRVWRNYGDAFDLHTYNLQRDEWDCEVPGSPEDEWVFCDIGAWQDRVFIFGMKFWPTRIMAWERCNHSEECCMDPWRLFDCMPEDLCSWMASEEVEWPGVNIQSRFCGEYVLVYRDHVTERAILYNLDRKTWEKVELPGPRRLKDL